MARKNKRNSRNFGWGKMLGYAGVNALKSAYRGGRHGAAAAHSSRWRVFCTWARRRGVVDARQIQTETLQRFANHLTESDHEISYIQNLISSTNVVLEAIRGDNQIWVSPVEALGGDMRRSNVRSIAPETSWEIIDSVCLELHKRRHDVAAVFVRLCRGLGLRCQEAAMINANSALIELQQHGKINVVAGTKGGRGNHIDRWIPVSKRAKHALVGAKNFQDNCRNLIPENETCHKFLTQIRSVVTPVLKEHNIKSLHELRAAYACDRYEQITGYRAPVITGQTCPDKGIDLQARETVSQELGHGRVNVVAAYIGGRS